MKVFNSGHPLIKIEIKYFKYYLVFTKYFNYENRFNGVFSRDYLPKIKYGTYVIILDDKKVKKHVDFHNLLTKT